MCSVSPRPSSCYGTVSSLNGEPEQGVAVEAVGQSDCSIYGEDTVTDEEGKFRLRGLLVRLRTCLTRGFFCTVQRWLVVPPRLLGVGWRVRGSGIFLIPVSTDTAYLLSSRQIEMGVSWEIEWENRGFAASFASTGWLWPRPGLSDQMPVGPEEEGERLKEAGCTLGSGEDCGKLERTWPMERGQLPLSSSSL